MDLAWTEGSDIGEILRFISHPTVNPCLKISTLGLKLWHFILSIWNLLNASKPLSTPDQMDVVSRLFIVLTPHSFYIYIYIHTYFYIRTFFGSTGMYASIQISNGMVLYYRAKFCAIYLPTCHHPNVLSPWGSYILVVNVFCILFHLLGGLFVTNLLLTQSVP